MAVYKFSGDYESEEGHHDSGTIVAHDQLDAYDKLRTQGYTNVHLKRVSGLSGFLQELTAGVR